MSSILSSQGMVFATAVAAVSGTVILLAFRHQKSSVQIPQSQQLPRSCISSDENKKIEKKKKRVQFAEDVVDPRGNGDEFRKHHGVKKASRPPSSKLKKSGGMPENRVALYDGILRDRVVHRLAYSY